MRVLATAFLIITLAMIPPCLAQQPPPPAPSLRSSQIPGGVLHWAGKGVARESVEDVTLLVANHTVRSYWLTPMGNVQKVPPPPTVYVDGRPLIVAQDTLPMPEAVLTGGGRTYVRIMEGVDEDDPPYLWIVDVSGPTATVTRKIKGCRPTKQAVINGAYVLTCDVNGEKRTVTHSYKDGVLK